MDEVGWRVDVWVFECGWVGGGISERWQAARSLACAVPHSAPSDKRPSPFPSIVHFYERSYESGGSSWENLYILMARVCREGRLRHTAALPPDLRHTAAAAAQASRPSST